MKVAITGTNSELGKALSFAYSNLGYEIVHINKSLGFDIADPSPIIKAISDCDIFVNCTHIQYYQSSLLEALWDKWQGDDTKRIVNIGSTLTIEFLEEIDDEKKREYYRQKKDLEITHRKLLIKNPSPKMHLIRVGEVYSNTEWLDCAKFIVHSLESSKDTLYLFELAVGK